MVFCKECKYKYDPIPGHYTYKCRAPIYRFSHLEGKVIVEQWCIDRNKDGNCKHFKPSLWTRIKRWIKRNS